VDRRRFLGLGVAAAAAALARPAFGLAWQAPSTGWSSLTLERRSRYTVGSAGDVALIAGGQAYNPQGATPQERLFDVDWVDLYDGRTGLWTSAKLSEARVEPTFATVGGTGLLIGGSRGPGSSDALDLFDSSTQSWTSARMSEPRSQPAVAVAGSKVVIAGGRNRGYVKSVDLFDTADVTLTTLTPPTVDGFEAWQVAANDTTAILVEVAGSRNDKVYRLDVATGALSTISLSQPRLRPTVKVVGDRAFIASTLSKDVDTLDVIDLVTGQVTPAPLPRPGIDQIRLDGEDGPWLIFQRPPTTEYNAADASRYDVFDPLRDRWSILTLPQPRQGAKVVVLGPMLYFVGGWLDTGVTPSAGVDIYNTETEGWVSAQLTVARSSFGIATLGNRVLVAGGSVDVQSRTKRKHFDAVDFFDPTGNVGLGQLSMARETPQDAVVNGRVLFVGGLIGCTSCPVDFLPPVVDIYDPTTA
jgi:hypothetical protein